MLGVENKLLLKMKKKIRNKKVYVVLAADILHEGHINILNKAASLGEITVGLLTDKAITSYKQIPLLNYSQREIILKNLIMVKNVIPQQILDHRPNLRKIKPDFIVHGNYINEIASI